MKLTVKELTVFSMLAAVMYVSKLVMEFLPNIHLLGVFVVSFTIVYRKKALYPIYLFVFLTGLLNGFNTWWIPYLYLWTVLWAAVMVLPKRLPPKAAPLIYMIVCGLHGLAYGTFYSPFQALMYGLNMEGMIGWIIAGLPFDITHGISNFICGILILPIVSTLKQAEIIIKNN